jgi:hypothetical protein
VNQRNFAAGLFLIGLGMLLFLVESTALGGETVVALIGTGLLGAYVYTRNYGFLVPGSILVGLGLGIMWVAQSGGKGGAVLIGLGLGFGLICVVDLLMKHTRAPWWPLIPSGILTTIGVLIESGREGHFADFAWLGPFGLMVVGAILLVIQGTGRGSTRGNLPGDPGKA